MYSGLNHLEIFPAEISGTVALLKENLKIALRINLIPFHRLKMVGFNCPSRGRQENIRVFSVSRMKLFWCQEKDVKFESVQGCSTAGRCGDVCLDVGIMALVRWTCGLDAVSEHISSGPRISIVSPTCPNAIKRQLCYSHRHPAKRPRRKPARISKARCNGRSVALT